MKEFSLKNSHFRQSLLAEARTDVTHFYDTFSFAIAFGEIINLWKTCSQIGRIFFQQKAIICSLYLHCRAVLVEGGAGGDAGVL